ncbi:MAG: chromate resistance protein ChrB domain-containing protein [Opitutaceae bacterium]
MRWITRERVKVDRVACPWLIRKFIDPEAEFFFVRLPRWTSGRPMNGVKTNEWDQ